MAYLEVTYTAPDAGGLIDQPVKGIGIGKGGRSSSQLVWGQRLPRNLSHIQLVEIEMGRLIRIQMRISSLNREVSDRSNT